MFFLHSIISFFSAYKRLGIEGVKAHSREHFFHARTFKNNFVFSGENKKLNFSWYHESQADNVGRGLEVCLHFDFIDLVPKTWRCFPNSSCT